MTEYQLNKQLYNFCIHECYFWGSDSSEWQVEGGGC